MARCSCHLLDTDKEEEDVDLAGAANTIQAAVDGLRASARAFVEAATVATMAQAPVERLRITDPEA